MALVASSGESGTKPHRRNFGETVENQTAFDAYHWMAGNFLKYGAADATFGARTANDIPIDAGELIALCAPRMVFVSYGSPQAGDPPWVDQRGGYMAAVQAGKVYRLLGAKDLGVGRRLSACRSCRRSAPACSTVRSPGASTTAATPMRRT